MKILIEVLGEDVRVEIVRAMDAPAIIERPRPASMPPERTEAVGVADVLPGVEPDPFDWAE